MLRLLSWLFHAMTALSLLLGMATAGLWVRSLWAWDEGEVAISIPNHWPTRWYAVGIESSGQRLRLTFTRFSDHQDTPIEDRHDRPRWQSRWARHADAQDPLVLDHGDEKDLQRRGGFGSEEQTMVGPEGVSEWTTVIVPHWAVVAATMPLGAFALLWLMVRGRRRQPKGTCSSCGYDLRAMPECCPECGWVPPRRAEGAR